MISNLYGIFDEKAEAFNSPVTFNHAGQAIRGFQDLCKDKNTMIGNHPGDFKLYKLGTINHTTGNIKATDIPELIASGSDFTEKLDKTK